MLTTILQHYSVLDMNQLLFTAGSLVVVFLLWLFVSHFILRTSVDNIPGPPSASLFSGLSDNYLHTKAY